MSGFSLAIKELREVARRAKGAEGTNAKFDPVIGPFWLNPGKSDPYLPVVLFKKRFRDRDVLFLVSEIEGKLRIRLISDCIGMMDPVAIVEDIWIKDGYVHVATLSYDLEHKPRKDLQSVPLALLGFPKELSTKSSFIVGCSAELPAR